MSKKLFSLIHGDSVHLAPKTKIVHAAAFSSLKSAEEVLENVKSDAIRYQQEVVAETEVLKEQAQREGFEAGFQQWVELIAKLEEEISRVRKDLEKVIIPVALSAAKKIVNKEIELSPDVILDIVSASLKAVSQHKRITIYVNKSDLNTVEAGRPRLKDLFEALESLSIRERADVPPGGCVIETEGGIINAQIENRWRIVENAFESMMKKSTENT